MDVRGVEYRRSPNFPFPQPAMFYLVEKFTGGKEKKAAGPPRDRNGGAADGGHTGNLMTEARSQEILESSTAQSLKTVPSSQVVLL
jgi:hypothetical protein